MRSTIAISALAAGALAAPLETRQTAGPTDAQILNYALTLEHLEDTFYRQAIGKFTQEDFVNAGASPKFLGNLKEISSDEETHVSFLTSALQAAGAPATAACTYDFGYTDVKGFLATANILEGVGVSAYLGAAQYIADKTYLTAAGAILTVESRHSAYLRQAQVPAQSPFPAAFDIPLDFDEVYSLAAQFITSCPSTNPALPVKAFPTLSVNPGVWEPVRQGQNIPFTIGKQIDGAIYAYFVTVTGPVEAEIVKCDGKNLEIIIPDAAPAGQSYLVLTNTKGTVNDDTIVAGPAIVPVQAKYTYNFSP